MLSNQLLTRREVPRLVASYPLLAGHQQIEEVVDHDRHLDAINRREHAPILRQLPTGATQLRTEMPRQLQMHALDADGQARPLGDSHRPPRSPDQLLGRHCLL
jgi:hypothetical protein